VLKQGVIQANAETVGNVTILNAHSSNPQAFAGKEQVSAYNIIPPRSASLNDFKSSRLLHPSQSIATVKNNE
jgi:hypothetical protein